MSGRLCGKTTVTNCHPSPGAEQPSAGHVLRPLSSPRLRAAEVPASWLTCASPLNPHDSPAYPLISKARASGDYSVSIDGLRAGRIMRQPRSFGAVSWLWSITGPEIVQAGLASSGDADSLVEARQAFRVAFDQWLASAIAPAGAVHWLE